MARAKKGATPAAEQPAPTPAPEFQSATAPGEQGPEAEQVNEAPAGDVVAAEGGAPSAEESAGLEASASAGAEENHGAADQAPVPHAPQDTPEAANDGTAAAGADLAATPAALPEQGAAAGATGAEGSDSREWPDVMTREEVVAWLAARVGEGLLDSATYQALVDQGAADDILPDGADIETSGLAQDLGDIQLTVTARATKTCGRLLWLEGQRRTFLHSDLDPHQLIELDEDPDFELDFHPA